MANNPENIISMVEYICSLQQPRMELGKVIFNAQRLHGRNLFKLVPNKTEFSRRMVKPRDDFEDYEDEALLKDQQTIIARFLETRSSRKSFFKKF